jgi:hypothetical protein
VARGVEQPHVPGVRQPGRPVAVRQI